MAKPALDKDLQKIAKLDSATHDVTRGVAAPGLAIMFLAAACVWAIFTITDGPFSYLVILGAVIAGYMALNIGANDVANNMGPAVGGKALTMLGALTIAAICEASGALMAGGDVVSTVSKDLIVTDVHFTAREFILVMTAASLSAAMWVHLATFLNAPVSTTHAVVGGVAGSGIAAAGVSAISWGMIAKIVASWVISPVLGGIFAALMLSILRSLILEREDKIGAARRYVPIVVAFMIGVFAMYLASKGLKRIWHPSGTMVIFIGIVAAILSWLAAIPWVGRRLPSLENRKKHVGHLFRLPLILATALLSFAHGANDVANAVGPLAAIVSTAESGLTSNGNVALPIWVLAIGGFGIAIGLALFGPRLIRTVGEKITRMNEVRSFCVALSAAFTVLLASALGLPVSSTHIAVGAIFGVGFLREFLWQRTVKQPSTPNEAPTKRAKLFNDTAEEAVANMQVRRRRRLVRRQHVYGIAAAWVITVPAAAVLSALLYLALELLIKV